MAGRPNPRPAPRPHPSGAMYIEMDDVGLLTAQEARSGEPSRESPGAPRELPSGRSRRRRGRRGRRLRPPPVDDGAVDPDPASRPRSPHPLWMHPVTGEIFPRQRHSQRAGGEGGLSSRGLRRSGPSSQPSSSASPSDHPGAEGARIRTYVRQSVLYSDRPRGLRRRQDPAPAEEHPNETSSNELGWAPFNGFSLSSPEDETDDDYDEAEEHPNEASSNELGRAATNFPLNGFSRSSPEEESDDDYACIEEELRLFEEYFAARPKNFWEAAAEIKARERAEEEEWRKELSKLFPDDKETRSFQPLQQHSSASAHPDLSMAQMAPRCEESEEKTIQNGKKWMNDEVMLCFKKYVERRPDLVGLVDYHLDELLHQCFNEDSYNKVYHHYNFTVRMKMPDPADWTVQLYFAEVKEVFQRKYYLCYPLEENENGQCYACKKQGVEDLRHPAIDVFQKGSLEAPECSYWYTDEE